MLAARALLLGTLCSLAACSQVVGEEVPATRSEHPATPRSFPGLALPAFASSTCPGRLPSFANDGESTTLWRSCAIPSDASPVWLAYDVRSIPAEVRRSVLAVWYNRTVNYDVSARDPGPALSMPRDYVLEAHSSDAGAPPTAGWVELQRVAGNTLHSRQAVLDLSEYQWFRMRVTAPAGSPNEYQVELELELHDGRVATDDWIFHGDSNTASAMQPYPIFQSCSGCEPRVATFAESIATLDATRTPVQESGGIIGQTAGEAAARLPKWISVFPGRYVVLAFGSNDAAPVRACDEGCRSAFRKAYESMFATVAAAKKTSVVPTIPPVVENELYLANIRVLNEELAGILAAHPEVARGPDLFAFFSAHPEMFGPDHVHLTSAGNAAYRKLWVDVAATLRR